MIRLLRLTSKVLVVFPERKTAGLPKGSVWVVVGDGLSDSPLTNDACGSIVEKECSSSKSVGSFQTRLVPEQNEIFHRRRLVNTEVKPDFVRKLCRLA